MDRPAGPRQTGLRGRGRHRRVTDRGDVLHEVQDGSSPFVIEFYPVEVADDEPVPHEHSEIAWLTVDELAGIPLAPADEAFVAWLETDKVD